MGLKKSIQSKKTLSLRSPNQNIRYKLTQTFFLIMNLGTKVRIKNCPITKYQGMTGVIEGLAPASKDAVIYKVRVSELTIVPGWFEDGDLELC